MKLVKATNLGITTSLNGILYNIGAEAIIVTDEVASALKEQFIQNVDITDVPVIDVPEPIKEETILSSEPIEEKVEEIVKVKKTNSRSNKK